MSADPLRPGLASDDDLLRRSKDETTAAEHAPPAPTEALEETLEDSFAAGSARTRALKGSIAPAGIPKRIGQYHIKRAIASGGMGTVYEAIQEKPRRTVAVKVMRAGITSRSALRRFEYESQLLARLRHPGIAQVYEAGTHRDDSGTVPYFAMEYIVGAKPVTDYAKDKKLGMRERMQLLAKVCDAVHHGHQKGIIHRDLKPSNILVDSSGQVKIIDFGVARSTDSDMAVTTLQTHVGDIIGTLQYMSPEQCAADPHDIDTRSDVYALGVVLYELLTEQLPYNLSGTAIHEATRVIREQEPPKPSTLNKKLRGDVGTIAMKALEKDRDRRYRSASELADDLHRYLNNEAISAHPPSVTYQLQVFARRHKGFFAATASVFLVLVAGVIVSTTMYLDAERARADAAAERDRAVAAEIQADQHRAEAVAVTKFLTETLESVDPGKAQGREVTVREMLDKSAETIAASFPDQPLVEAAVRMTVGRTYDALGLYPTAEPHLRAALEISRRELGNQHADTASSMYALGGLLWDMGAFEQAEALHREALTVRKRLFGDEHLDVAESLNHLAMLLWKKRNYKQAESFFRDALGIRRKLLGDEHPDVAQSLNNLAALHWTKRDLLAAERCYREALTIVRKLRGDWHPEVATSLNNLAMLLKRKGNYDDAETLFREALAIKQKVYDDEHPDVAVAMENLGVLLCEKGNLEEGAALLHGAVDRKIAIQGADHWSTGNTQSSLGGCLMKMDQYSEAEKELRNAYGVLQAALGDEHGRTVNAVKRLADLYEAWGKPDQATEWRAKMPSDANSNTKEPPNP